MSERLAPPAEPSEAPSAEPAPGPDSPTGPASQDPASQDPASQDPAGQDPASQDPASQDLDPLAEMRATLGLPYREGGTPITANLDVTLRRLGWGMLGLGTAFLLLWRILSWINA